MFCWNPKERERCARCGRKTNGISVKEENHRETKKHLLISSCGHCHLLRKPELQSKKCITSSLQYKQQTMMVDVNHIKNNEKRTFRFVCQEFSRLKEFTGYVGMILRCYKLCWCSPQTPDPIWRDSQSQPKRDSWVPLQDGASSRRCRVSLLWSYHWNQSPPLKPSWLHAVRKSASVQLKNENHKTQEQTISELNI